MFPLGQERKGALYVFTSASLWGIFPIITVLTYNQVTPLVSLAGSTAFAAIFFAFIITYRKKWSDFKNTAAIKDILLTTLLLGVLFYFLYFIGLLHTSAGNASIIALSETFFSYIFFNIWKKEYFSTRHVIGSLLMIAGAGIVLLPNMTSFQWGDLLILAAAAVAPFGNFFQRRARERASSEIILFIRSLLTVPAALLLAYAMGHSFRAADASSTFWQFLFSGFVLFGLSKIFWIEGIHRISVTKSNALSAITPFITLLSAWAVLGEFPTLFQMAAIIPMCAGMMLLNRTKTTV